ncbi:MAG: Hsp70 family protein [Chlamydiales bacterium]|nr:Hsp70 family protein [Chlamydiales bacterium]
MIGIDLGTTNCTLAFKGENGIEQFPILQQITADMEAEKFVLPSFFCFPLEGAPFLGWYARERGAELPERVIASAKSWLCHDAIDRRSPILPLSGPKMSPVEVCAALLKHLRASFSEEESALVTVPASFDPSARQLVEEAAKSAGFGEVVLLEEPLAAFYAWLHRHQEDWREILKIGDTVLVADIGGGTTDFSLIAVEERGGELHLERKAVGDHLLLGGDNIDLSLAYMAHQKLGGEERPGMVHAVRRAKEVLLGVNPPDSFDVTLEGRGSSVIGGSVTVTLQREEVEKCLVDGFFPMVELDEQVQKEARSGIAKLGLPYARDPRITAQLARFLREADADLPTAVLFNGGTLKAAAFQRRLLAQLSKWRGEEVNALPDPDYDFGVSRGAVYYGMTREGEGIRVRAGTSRSYYIGVEGTAPAVPGVPPPIKPVLVVPMGMEEGTELTLEEEDFTLLLDEPAFFRFFSSASGNGELKELHPIETVLRANGEEGNTVLVKLRAKVTELGMLELWCVARDGRKWKLEFDTRREECGLE